MALDLSCRLVFLASPSLLEAERLACRDVVAEYTEQHALQTKATFFLQAWEDFPGGVGRPQDRINPHLDDCDYAIFMFSDWWGTPPSKGSEPYSSGTEEEFHRALGLLEDPEAPMRDILVFFKSLDPERLRDPGESLKKVLRFRSRLEKSKDLQYEVFDSTENLRMRVARLLRQWDQPLGEKVARRVVLPAGDVEEPPSPSEGNEAILTQAKAFAEEGRLVQAEAAFSVAVQDEDPDALLEFAKFMRRTGRLEQASELNSQVVRQPKLLLDDSAKAVSQRVEAMTNIGIIERKTGRLAESVNTLSEAVQTASESHHPIPSAQCNSLDNYGHSLMAVKRNDQALVQFEKASSVREQCGTAIERAQSAINLGRAHMRMREFEAALAEFGKADTLMGSATDDHLLANSLAGTAESLIELGQYTEVADYLKRALAANERLHNRDGQSIVHGLWARLYLSLDRPEDAKAQLTLAQSLIDQTGNAQGRVVIEELWKRLVSSGGA